MATRDTFIQAFFNCIYGACRDSTYDEHYQKFKELGSDKEVYIKYLIDSAENDAKKDMIRQLCPWHNEDICSQMQKLDIVKKELDVVDSKKLILKKSV